MFKTGCVLVFSILILSMPGSGAPASRPDIPTSARATKAVRNVTPKLEKALAAKNLKFGAPIYVRIFKQEKALEVWVRSGRRFTLFKTYPVCTFGSGGIGPKLRVGDGKAPEGFYYVPPGALNPASIFHLSFNLGYPNKYDRAHGRTGSALMVHGKCVSIGCYAMTDAGIEEIYALADAAFRSGQTFFRVHIFPFRMNDANMTGNRESEWYSFWENLKQGYDLFEKNGRVPPDVDVRGGRYVFDIP